jgi:hypothetical protein
MADYAIANPPYALLKTSQVDGDHKSVRIIVDALAKVHGIPVNYPPSR